MISGKTSTVSVCLACIWSCILFGKLIAPKTRLLVHHQIFASVARLAYSMLPENFSVADDEHLIEVSIDVNGTGAPDDFYSGIPLVIASCARYARMP